MSVTKSSILAERFKKFDLNEVEGMNLLQDWGVISDNCVWAKDIAECDIPIALNWLTENQDKIPT